MITRKSAASVVFAFAALMSSIPALAGAQLYDCQVSSTAQLQARPGVKPPTLIRRFLMRTECVGESCSARLQVEGKQQIPSRGNSVWLSFPGATRTSESRVQVSALLHSTSLLEMNIEAQRPLEHRYLGSSTTLVENGQLSLSSQLSFPSERGASFVLSCSRNTTGANSFSAGLLAEPSTCAGGYHSSLDYAGAFYRDFGSRLQNYRVHASRCSLSSAESYNWISVQWPLRELLDEIEGHTDLKTPLQAGALTSGELFGVALSTRTERDPVRKLQVARASSLLVSGRAGLGHSRIRGCVLDYIREVQRIGTANKDLALPKYRECQEMLRAELEFKGQAITRR